jgi:hypothetical protein
MMPQNANAWNAPACRPLWSNTELDSFHWNKNATYKITHLFSSPCTTKFHLLPQKSDGDDDSNIGFNIIGPCCRPQKLVMANIPNASVVRYSWKRTLDKRKISVSQWTKTRAYALLLCLGLVTYELPMHYLQAVLDQSTTNHLLPRTAHSCKERGRSSILQVELRIEQTFLCNARPVPM